MKIGIVGSEAAKFTRETKALALELIDYLVNRNTDGLVGGYLKNTVVSGGCHLGGIDTWAAEMGLQYGLDVIEYKPKNLQWSTGYKPRNLQIARESDEVHCITVRELPPNYRGMRFPLCYHCAKEGPGFADVPHVKSGGCWTMHQARKLGKPGYLHII